MIHLQVIWAIGLSMVTVAALIRFPRPLQIFNIALASSVTTPRRRAFHLRRASFIPGLSCNDRSRTGGGLFQCEPLIRSCRGSESCSSATSWARSVRWNGRPRRQYPLAVPLGAG